MNYTSSEHLTIDAILGCNCQLAQYDQQAVTTTTYADTAWWFTKSHTSTLVSKKYIGQTQQKFKKLSNTSIISNC